MDDVTGTPSVEKLRAPEQQRSRKSLEAIYLASVELLTEGGWDALKIGDVERRSGVSRGTLYWRFPRLDALVAYVRERIVAEVTAEQRRAFETALAAQPTSLPHAVGLAVHAMASVFSTYGELLIRLESPQHSAVDPTTIDDLGTDFARVLSPFVTDDHRGRRALEHATRSTFANLVSMVRRREPFAGHEPFTWDEGLDLIVEETTAYLETVPRTS